MADQALRTRLGDFFFNPKLLQSFTNLSIWPINMWLVTSKTFANHLHFKYHIFKEYSN